MKNSFFKNSLLVSLFLIGFSFNSKAMFYDLIVDNVTGCTMNFSTYDASGTQIGITFVSIGGSGVTNVCVNTGSAVPYYIVVDDGSTCSASLGYGVWPASYMPWSWGPGLCSCNSGTWIMWQTPNPVCGGAGMTVKFVI